MPLVVPVKFTYASRDLWFDPRDLDIVEADYAICKTERGIEIGLVTADPYEVPEAELRAPLKPVLRIANDDDLDYADELAQKGEDAMYDFRRLVKQNGLDMKPVGVEYLFGGEKLVFYFAAEDRVDFRQLVRDLSACFHTRVDMRQIGVRDETRLVGGFAHCGQELCCARFGGNFEPVSIRMAKEQDLPLNSTKISGMCGRLMCCLRYEFDAYKDFKGRAPKKKALIDTPLGKARIVEYNAPREQLVLRLESGKVFRVDLADMTCSDEAKKRAEEQHCNCRPDCVTRDILDKIDSADMRMALVELDRQNGVDVGDGLGEADRLVAGDAGKRRRRGGAGAGAGSGSGSGGGGSRRGKGQGQGGQGRTQGSQGSQGEGSGQRGQAAKGRGGADEAAPASGKRRRRRLGSGSGSGAAEVARGEAPSAAKAEGQAQQQQQQGGARRRHRTSEAAGAQGGAPQAQGGGGQQPAQGGSRPRKHTAAGGAGNAAGGAAGSGGASAGRSQKPDVPSVAEQVAEGQVQVRRRRPGDGGGQGQDGQAGQRQQGQQAKKQGQKQGGQSQRQGEPQAQGGQGGQAQGGEVPGGEAQGQKRRRRRRRKPSQGGEAQGQQGQGGSTGESTGGQGQSGSQQGQGPSQGQAHAQE